MASGSRKGRRKGSAKRQPPTLSPELRRKLAGIALLAAGAVAALSLLFPNGDITSFLSRLMLLAAGWGAMSIPIGLLWIGALLLKVAPAARFPLNQRQELGVALLLLSFIGSLHLFPVGEQDLRVRADTGAGGGYLGYLVAVQLRHNLGAVGSALVLLAGMVGGAALWARAHPRRVLDAMRAGWAAFRTWRAERAREVRINPARATPASPQAPSTPPTINRFTREAPAPAEGTAGEDSASPEGTTPWALPPIDIFEVVPEAELSQVDIKQRIRCIEETLRSFGVDAHVAEVNQGPAVTQFGVEPGVGVKVARIMALANDLALRLAAAPLRLEAPVPGKHVVGIEVPNGTVAVVSIREILESTVFQKHKSRLRLTLGRDVSGSPVVGDLTKMPHLLIAGATGSGKSVCLNSFIASMLYLCTPDDLRLLMIDPKMVEMAPFNGVPHLLTPVVTEVDLVVPSLKWVTKEMERRYRMFAARGSRNLDAYNRSTTGKGSDLPLPYIVVIIDELADLMMMAPDEVEKIICRIAQLARATGIHLVVATQRPSVDVVTGLIKANFPTRISFAVTSQIDSRVILDQAGAEKLLGRGDMLYMPTDSVKPIRLQGTYVSDGEIRDLVDYWKKARPPGAAGVPRDVVPFEPVEEDEADDLFEQAVEEVAQHSRVSTSLLQRRLRIGYNRAARLMDLLEKEGIVGPSENGKSREVLARTEASGDDVSSEDEV